MIYHIVVPTEDQTSRYDVMYGASGHADPTRERLHRSRMKKIICIPVPACNVPHNNRMYTGSLPVLVTTSRIENRSPPVPCVRFPEESSCRRLLLLLSVFSCRVSATACIVASVRSTLITRKIELLGEFKFLNKNPLPLLHVCRDINFHLDPNL